MIRRRFPVLVRFVSGALDTELFGIVMTRLSVVRSVVYTRPMDSTVPSPELGADIIAHLKRFQEQDQGSAREVRERILHRKAEGQSDGTDDRHEGGRLDSLADPPP